LDVTQLQAKVIRELGYYDYFDPVILSYQTGVEKPAPGAFQALLKALKIPASKVIFIDDKIENVNGAKKHGIDALHFLNPAQLKEELKSRGIFAWASRVVHFQGAHI
jgi:FMN phosphatase YigB (HAD superfamily)